MTQEKDRFSYAVIGKAMETHRELGPGLDEKFYHHLLASKLSAAGIPHRFKPRGQLVHRGILADEFEADVIFGEELVLELKVLWGVFAPEHLLQIICYLKFWALPAGLLFDFGKESLAHRRVAYTAVPAQLDVSKLVEQAPAFISDRKTLAILAESLARILDQYGLGYRDTTYRGLLAADLKAGNVPCEPEPMATVRGAEGVLGETRLPCLLLPGRCGVLVTALRDTHQAADRAVLQTYLKHLRLPWGLHVNFGKRDIEYQHVIRPKEVPR